MFAEPTLCLSLRVVESSANTAEPACDISWCWSLGFCHPLQSHSAVVPMGLELCVLGWVILARSDGAAAAWGLDLGSWQVLKGLFAKG